MKRRDFLQRAGWTLTALGLSAAEWLRLGDRYYQAIAQPGSRKLALLVGINQYPHQALTGCLTDVELQRELLIHRFGFQPLDILTLSDQQASRQQIETAFVTHLTDQAQPGDVVVFHFSGYGRRVQLESKEDVLNSLVPVDGVVPTSGVPVVNDLLEQTLWLLLRSLSTDRVTTILDTGYKAASKDLQGNLRIRARPQAQGQLSPQAQDFQAQLLNRQGGSELLTPPIPPPGVVLIASGASQLAAEARWSGFSAGLFTYALTQYLWEASPAASVLVSLSRVTGVVEQVGGKQQPVLSGHSSIEQSEVYDLIPDTNVGADGVVIAVGDDGKTAHLWLAGLPLPVLEYYAANSLLNVVTPTLTLGSGESGLSKPSLEALQLQLRSRTGLTAKAQLFGNTSLGSLQVGQLVQESVRVLPRNIDLVVALDTGLERIERVDATSAFAAIPHVSSVIAGEQLADYLFGRVQETNQSELQANASSRYGLFSLSQELIPNTAGEVGEAVKMAVQRLIPKLQTLQAVKMLRLTTNEGSSRLGVRAILEMITNRSQVLIQRETLRRSNSADLTTLAKLGATSAVIAPEASIPTVLSGSRIQYRVHNDSDRPVYLVLLGLDSNKSAIALYPTDPKNETNSTQTKPLLKDVVIASGETLIIPDQTSVNFEWVIHGPSGLAEIQLIFSNASFTQTLTSLEASMQSTEAEEHIKPLLNPVEVVQAVLQDLHQASAVKVVNPSSSTDTYALDVNAWAGLSFVYQVI